MASFVFLKRGHIYKCLDGTMTIDKLIKLPSKSCTNSNIHTSDDRRLDGGSDLDVDGGGSDHVFFVSACGCSCCFLVVAAVVVVVATLSFC